MIEKILFELLYYKLMNKDKRRVVLLTKGYINKKLEIQNKIDLILEDSSERISYIEDNKTKIKYINKMINITTKNLLDNSNNVFKSEDD